MYRIQDWKVSQVTVKFRTTESADSLINRVKSDANINIMYPETVTIIETRRVSYSAALKANQRSMDDDMPIADAGLIASYLDK